MSEITTHQGIIPFLWYDGQAESAIHFYTQLFPHSKIISIQYWQAGGQMPETWLMQGIFEINGLRLHAFDAGPMFKFNESISFFVKCKDQEEVDKYWNAITERGAESECGWCKDEYGVSWQIVPAYFIEKSGCDEPRRFNQMLQAMLGMKKMIVAELEAAYNRD